MENFTYLNDYFRAITKHDGKDNHKQWDSLSTTARKLFDQKQVTGLHYEYMPHVLDGELHTYTEQNQLGELVSKSTEINIDSLGFIVIVKAGNRFIPFKYEVAPTGKETFLMYGNGYGTMPTNLGKIIELLAL